MLNSDVYLLSIYYCYLNIYFIYKYKTDEYTLRNVILICC